VKYLLTWRITFIIFCLFNVKLTDTIFMFIFFIIKSLFHLLLLSKVLFTEFSIITILMLFRITIISKRFVFLNYPSIRLIMNFPLWIILSIIMNLLQLLKPYLNFIFFYLSSAYRSAKTFWMKNIYHFNVFNMIKWVLPPLIETLSPKNSLASYKYLKDWMK